MTLTVAVAVAEHPIVDVPITVYDVEVVGLATTTEPVLVFRFPEGDHEYEAAPDALRLVLWPTHIVVLEGLTVTSGSGETLIV